MRLSFFICLFLSNIAEAQIKVFANRIEQKCAVVKIIDGDTFDVLTRENRTIRVRMYGIDSPERKQDFYKVSKDALADYILTKEIKLVTRGWDRNKRTIAIVFCNSENINLAMIKNGYAWHYKKYSTDTAYANAEIEARRKNKGLWQMSKSMPPWEFRKR